MAHNAMRFSAVDGLPAVAAENVFDVRHCFKVIGIDAIPNATKMVQRQPIRNPAFRQFVGHSVSIEQRSLAAARTVNPKHPVASRMDCCCPEPAGVGLVDPRPESIYVLSLQGTPRAR